MKQTIFLILTLLACGSEPNDSGTTDISCEITTGTLSVHALEAWGGERNIDYDLRVTPTGEETFTIAASAPNFSVDLEAGDYTLDVYETPDGCFATDSHDVSIVACEISEVEIEFDCWGR